MSYICSGMFDDEAGEYDEYEEGLLDGTWIKRNGESIQVTDMTTAHLRNTIGVVKDAFAVSTYTCESDKWQDWIDLLEDELGSRNDTPARSSTPIVKKSVRGRTNSMECHCGNHYNARVADLNRGWALSCSKRCAAIRREFGRPEAKLIR